MRRVSLNKVPEITLYFWVIKILCTTVGESAADFLNENLHFGLIKTSAVMSALLVVALGVQIAQNAYKAGIYWVAVVLISVVGTLITDNLTDHFGVTLQLTSVLFTIALVGVFVVWYALEKTLSIHSIVTVRREGFYWLAILFTFALGTAAGDLAAESLKLGYLVSALIFAAMIALVAVVHFGARASAKSQRQPQDAVWAFWIAYILTRPLGASIGDYLSQAPDAGGLGLGAMLTSAIFLALILVTVVYLSVSKKDVTPAELAKS